MAATPTLQAALVDALRRADHVCVLTGAGISAESGVPTFRAAQTGLRARYDPLELATPVAFERDPALVRRCYRWRRDLVRAAAPNSGHVALARLAHCVPRFTLVTQNLDALHQRAGSEDVIEFHGNVFETRCVPVEINPAPTQAAAEFDFAIATRAGVILPELVDSLPD